MIYGRGRGVWYVQIELGRDVDGKRRRLSRQVKGTKKDAEKVEARLRREVELGEFIEPSKETVATFCTRWLADMHGRLAPSAWTAYHSIAERRIIPSLGGIRLQDLRAAHIKTAERGWVQGGRLSRIGPLSPKTLVNYHRVLREILQAAVREGLIHANPCEQMDPPRWERQEQRALTLEEVDRLLVELHRAKHGAALHTLLATGLRVGEVLGLRWREDVDLDHGVVRVQRQYDRVLKGFRATKTYRSRRPVAIDSGLVAVLRRHRARQNEVRLAAGGLWQESGLVFTDALGGHLSHETLRYALNRCLEKAGLDHITRHGLRHTHASVLVQLGVHMKQIQERLGHASFAITADTYSHIAPGEGVRVAEVFGAAVRGGSKGEAL